MTINQIPTKSDKKAVTDTAHQLSAEEFNTVVTYIKNILGVQLTQDEYDALTTKDSNKYYYIVDTSQGGGSDDDDDSGSGTSGSVTSTVLTLTNASVSGEILTITNATVSGNVLILS